MPALIYWEKSKGQRRTFIAVFLKSLLLGVLLLFVR